MCSNVIPGLSYRKGLFWSRSEGYHELLCLHPLDLRTALTVVNCTNELDATYVYSIFNP